MGFVDEAYAAWLASPPDAARDVVVGQVAFELLLKLTGFGRVETLADECAERVAEDLRQLLVPNTGEVRVFDDVARVDVVIAIRLIPAAHDEEHARASVRLEDAAHGGDVAWAFGLEPRGELVEALLIHRRAGELADLFAKAGAQAIDVEAGHVRRGDDGAFRHGGLSDPSPPAATPRAG